MTIMIPQELTNRAIISNIPKSYTYDDYDGSKEYAKGDIVRFNYLTSYTNSSETAYHSWYRFIPKGGGITNRNPYDDPTYWEHLRPDNRTAMFDKYMESQTITDKDGLFQVEFSVVMCTMIALFNVEATYIWLDKRNDADDGWDEIFKGSMVEPITLGGKTYYEFLPTMIMNLPTNDMTRFRVTLSHLDDKTKSSGYVKLGKIVAGLSFDIGDTLYPIDMAFNSLSVKSKDESGYSYYDKRSSYKSATYTIMVQNDQRDNVFRWMQRIDAKDCVFLPDKSLLEDTTIVYGTMNDFSISLENVIQSEYELSVEGSI